MFKMYDMSSVRVDRFAGWKIKTRHPNQTTADLNGSDQISPKLCKNVEKKMGWIRIHGLPKPMNTPTGSYTSYICELGGY